MQNGERGLIFNQAPGGLCGFDSRRPTQRCGALAKTDEGTPLSTARGFKSRTPCQTSERWPSGVSGDGPDWRGAVAQPAERTVVDREVASSRLVGPASQNAPQAQTARAPVS